MNKEKQNQKYGPLGPSEADANYVIDPDKMHGTEHQTELGRKRVNRELRESVQDAKAPILRPGEFFFVVRIDQRLDKEQMMILAKKVLNLQQEIEAVRLHRVSCET